MGVAKSINPRVGIMVAATTIPTFEASVRAELNESERGGCTWIGVSMSAGADERIDEICEWRIGGETAFIAAPIDC